MRLEAAAKAIASGGRASPPKLRLHHNTASQPQGSKALAERLRYGRAELSKLALMHTSLFTRGPSVPLPAGVLDPAAGLFASFQGGPVFIVDTLTYHGKPLADIVPIMGDSVLQRRGKRTCRTAELSDVGMHYRVLGFSGHTVRVQRRASQEEDGACLGDSLGQDLADARAAAASWRVPLAAPELPRP